MALPAAFPNVTNLTGYMQDESVVNGVWNHILSQCFPFDEFIIAPEYRIPNFRVDLAVIRRVDQRIVFVYEGKREGYTNWQYDQHIAQLAGYLAVMASQGKRGGSAYGLFGGGTEFAFARHSGGNTVTCIRDTYLFGDYAWMKYDLTRAEDKNKAHQILCALVAKCREM